MDAEDQEDGSLSVVHIMIIVASLCALIGVVGAGMYAYYKKTGKQRLERRLKQRRRRAKRIKRTARKKFIDFKKSRRGVMPPRRSSINKDERSSKKKSRVPQESFDTPIKSNKSRRSRSGSQKEDVYKGVDFLRPVSRGGQADIGTSAVAMVTSISKSKSLEADVVESSSGITNHVTNRRFKSRDKAKTKPEPDSEGTFAGFMEKIYSFTSDRSQHDVSTFQGDVGTIGGDSRITYESRASSFEPADLTLSDSMSLDDANTLLAWKEARRRHRNEGVMDEMAHEVSDALKDLKSLLD